jgi:polyisoprenoid-binding protein YceI
VAHYVLDKSASRFTVRAFAGGMLSALGHSPTLAIRDFSGQIEFEPGDPSKSSLRLAIRAGSLEVMDEIKSSDRNELESTMNQKVLEIAKYPAIVYESTQAAAEQLAEGRYKAAIQGNLSLHGLTRSQPVTAQVTLAGNVLRASGEFAILQTHYGIKLVNVAGGALKVKDELKFNFDLVARKQE